MLLKPIYTRSIDDKIAAPCTQRRIYGGSQLWSGTGDAGEGAEKKKNKKKKKSVFDMASESVENVVKKTKLVSEDYKLGDISKGALSKTFEMLDADGDGDITLDDFVPFVESAAKSTGVVDEDYKLGDLSKKAVETLGGAMEGTVQKVTGDAGYKFGDYTSSFLKSGDDALNRLREEAFNQLPKQVWEDVLDGLTAPQREAVAVSLIQLGAVCLLAFNLASNCVACLTWVRAWAMVTARTRSSPLATGAQWGEFLRCRAR